MMGLRLALLFLLTFAGITGAKSDEVERDELAKTIYEKMEDSAGKEYGEAVSNLLRHGVPNAIGPTLKLLFYNKAALFAFCAADAEQAHTPGTARIPARQNIVLTTCVEQRFKELDAFNNKLSYARVFFPERVARCGETSRLYDRERLLPPYQFLQLADPRLYDFMQYNRCLMTAD